jgi:HAD superfamily hydrolase (TIGR01450 family)
VTDLLSQYDSLLVDLDGTAYCGDTVVAGAPATLEQARRRGIAVRYVTNNASRSAADVAAKLRGFGFTATAGDVDTSAHAAATVLAEKLDEDASVLVVGTEALADEVRRAGLTPCASAEGPVDAVVQGFSEDTGWRMLAEACVAIRGGAWWVASNSDPTLPTERGPLPGNGSLVAALRTATGAEPVVAGKPGLPLLREAAEASGAQRQLVVGDRLDTDIAGATRAGFDALLVLSGVTGTPDLLAATPEQRPRYVGADVRAVCEDAANLVVAPVPGWKVDGDASGPDVDGDGDALGLLRTLCAWCWEHDHQRPSPRARSDAARRALTDLGLLT